jgi:uncharacterized protein
VEHLSSAEACTIIVSRQGFVTRNRVATADNVLATIGRLGCVQLDSVMTVARAHRLTLAARVGKVPATTLNGLRRSGSIAEVWAHEASLIDANDLPYFRGGMLREQQHRWWGAVLQEHPKIAKEVLCRIEAEGPLTPGDFGGAGTPGWWEWSPVKQVFEALFSSGQLAVRERRSFARVYDLPERLYSTQQLAPADDADALRWRVLRAVTARGIVTERRLSDYFRVSGRSRPLATPVAELIDEGGIVRVQVGEHPALADPVVLTPPDHPTAVVLLCPFDNLIWDRDETERLFDFRHRLEIYVPKAKRQYGYYVLPLLVGSRIVGRADVKADRKAGDLRILAMHWNGRPAPRALDRAATRLAWTLGLPSVTFV